ncbi:hypothetical protein FEDK69T_20700 [Flavobacterium enshiense DK69]|nr:hypothetical protein FEDK69T_20700 [Flavobacterium enshiense DK69]
MQTISGKANIMDLPYENVILFVLIISVFSYSESKSDSSAIYKIGSE